MSSSAKVLLSNLTYDNLKIAAVLLAIGSFLMFYLFGLAPLSPLELMPFDDTIGMKTNLFFSFFLDFSGVVSSLLTVLMITGFIGFQLVMLSCYMNDQSNKWFFFIFVSILTFFVWVSCVGPSIKKLENQYLTQYSVGNMVYSNNHEKAYGIVGSEKISALNKAYLNAQISADQYNQFPNQNNMMLLNADVTQLDNLMTPDEGGTVFVDKNVAYKVYKTSTKKELPNLDQMVSGMNRSVYFYALLIFVTYCGAMYNIYLFRVKSGMSGNW